MTRINSAIPVKCLTDEHLLAEHREIKRLTHNLQQSIKSGSINRIPEKFTLGRGHIIFFLNKMKFTYRRYCDIYDELAHRGFDVTSFHSNWNDVPKEFYCDYSPTTEEHALLINRIEERLMNSPKKSWHYYGEKITKENAIHILKHDIHIDIFL